MVTTLNVTLDDDDHEKAKRVKQDLDVTWSEFIVRAADELDGQAGDGTDPIEAALEGWSYGRTDEEQEASRTVARQSLEWLRDTAETVRQSDVPLEELADADPEGRSSDTIWRSVVRGAWNHASGQGFVEKPDSRAYRWVGE